MTKVCKMLLCLVLVSVFFVAGMCITGCGEDYKELDEETATNFIFEAEEATLVGDALKTEKMEYQGNGHVVNLGENDTRCSQGKYVGYMGAKQGDYIEWIIEAKEACIANLSFNIKSSTRLYYFIKYRDEDTSVFVNGEKVDIWKDEVTCVLNGFSEAVTYMGIKLKKGENSIRMGAMAPEMEEFWIHENGPMFDYYKAAYSKMPDVDYMRVVANVGEDGLVFKNQTLDNEENPNGWVGRTTPQWAV